MTALNTLTIKAPTEHRLASIDIFRGLTMMVMIFVNDLESVRGLPWWTYHMKAEINAMTYVDMVFPFFLFIIGLSIPIAVRQRLKKNPSVTALGLHVLLRSISLVVLGLILANADKGSRRLMGFSQDLWALFALTGAALFLSVYKPDGSHPKLHRWLHIAGFILTVAMFAWFRRVTPEGETAWIDGSYPEILGLLGYTYFAVAILYIATRRWAVAPFLWFVALMVFSSIRAAGWTSFPYGLPLCLWPFGDGTMAFITMAGVVISMIFVAERKGQTLRNKSLLSIGFAVLAFAVGRVLAPLGISKIRDTPTWGLYSVGAAVLLFIGLYWICDVKKMTAWAAFVRPAGANTMLTYLLPDFYYFAASLAGFSYFANHLNYGWQGVAITAVFTAIVLMVAACFTRWKIRLQL